MYQNINILILVTLKNYPLVPSFLLNLALDSIIIHFFEFSKKREKNTIAILRVKNCVNAIPDRNECLELFPKMESILY